MAKTFSHESVLFYTYISICRFAAIPLISAGETDR